MKIILVCNYAADAQQSMLRFGTLLREQWTARGCAVRCIAPEPSAAVKRAGRVAGEGWAKWLGYVDKYILFPPRLRRQLRAETVARTVVHVVDHSNAVYIPRNPRVPWVVTCHDLLAVRGALGEEATCPASPFGRQLQSAVRRGLGRASAIVTVSTSTMDDLQRLIVVHRPQPRRVIFLGFHHPYRPIDVAEARIRLKGLGTVPWHEPFLVHVGSNHPRKNKAGVLRVFARVCDRWAGNLVFCGDNLPPDLRMAAEQAGLSDRVFAVAAPDNAQLEAIYRFAHALVFPSICEGFGWPVIEAQACGCPVVCSDRTSLPEVGGTAALMHALDDEQGMAESVLRLVNPMFRADVVARGTANISRFSTDRMMDAYGEVYADAIARRASG